MFRNLWASDLNLLNRSIQAIQILKKFLLGCLSNTIENLETKILPALGLSVKTQSLSFRLPKKRFIGVDNKWSLWEILRVLCTQAAYSTALYITKNKMTKTRTSTSWSNTQTIEQILRSKVHTKSCQKVRGIRISKLKEYLIQKLHPRVKMT